MAGIIREDIEKIEQNYKLWKSDRERNELIERLKSL